MVKGWRTITLRDDLVARIDTYVASNDYGFTNRGVLVAEVMRRFLDSQGDHLTRSELERALKAVAATDPKTPAALLDALLAELDMGLKSTGGGGPPVGQKRGARPTPTRQA